MPKTSSNIQWQQLSIRVTPKTLSYLKKRGDELGSVTDAVREAIEAAHTFFGLPDLIVNALHEDAAKQGKDDLAYVRELLTQRYQELMIEQGRASKK